MQVMIFTEGAGGGNAPDIIKVASHPNVTLSLINPTISNSVNTIEKYLDTLVVCHQLDKLIPKGVAFGRSMAR